jgi:hypothetical protein
MRSILVPVLFATVVSACCFFAGERGHSVMSSIAAADLGAPTGDPCYALDYHTCALEILQLGCLNQCDATRKCTDAGKISSWNQDNVNYVTLRNATTVVRRGGS